MEARNTVIPSSYFEKREIHLADDEIVLVACMRNEFLRLPYFLDHYRRLGVGRFLLVDNDSTDGTRDYLLGQEDVEYFHTAASFRGSDAGRLWNHELSQTYAMGHWVLTPDLDEMFVFPGAELFGLRALCSYLDEQHYDGVIAPMVDMYSDVPLSQTRYEPGDDLLQACPYFETDSYSLETLPHPPFLGVYGGPRRDWFAQGPGIPRPLYTKVPLVKWREGFSYIAVAHMHRAIQLADVSGAMLHFKFLAAWKDVVATDVARGDRRSGWAYEAYADHTTSDLCFFGPQSLRYDSPRDLVRLGVMAAPEPLRRFFRDELVRVGEDGGAADHVLPHPSPSGSQLTLRSMAAVWPLIQNPAIMRHFSRDEPRRPEYQVHLIQELRRQFAVVDVFADEVLISIQNAALHRWRRTGLALALYVGDRFVARVMADGSEPGLETVIDSLESNVCRWKVDLAAAAVEEASDGSPVLVSVFLTDAGDPGAGPIEPVGHLGPRPQDALLFSGRWHQKRISPSLESGVLGEVHDYLDGEVRGWVYDVNHQTFDVPISVYVNDRLVRHSRPNRIRRPLAERLGCPPGVVGRGFRLPVPLGYFRHAGVDQVQIAVRVSGTNVVLDRTPIVLPSDTRTARWREGQGWTKVSDDA